VPHFGTQDVKAAAGTAPALDALRPEPWTLPGAEILQLTFEIEEEPADALIAPALHPSIPPYASFSVTRVPESPVGPFALAQVRVIARAGIRPRGYALGAFASTDAATAALRSGWGFPVQVADVTLSVRHDRIVGRVDRGGDTLLHIELEDPEQIDGGALALADNLHLVRGPDEDLLILQVDPEYTFHRAERGRPELLCFDPAAWNAVGLHPTDPIAAVACRVDTDLPAPRFAMDPLRPAIEGTRRLDR
jgi:hypothetical protein